MGRSSRDPHGFTAHPDVQIQRIVFSVYFASSMKSLDLQNWHFFLTDLKRAIVPKSRGSAAVRKYFTPSFSG